MGRTSGLFLFFMACSISFSSSVVSANELSLVVAQPTTLMLSPSFPVEKSTSSKPSAVVLCERIQIRGLSRLRNLRKYTHSVKVKVSLVNSSARLPNVEVCFHRNFSLRIGMCPQGQWEKLVKGSWVRSMSPFDHKLLDIQMAGSSSEILQASIEEEFFLYRIIFLVLGVIIMTSASSLSKSLVFYYSSAMAIGFILVILMVLFQLAMLLLVFLVLAGAWLGFWVVRKLVLTEDGLIDIGVSHFVAWSIRIIAAVMILQSSVDPLLAVEALLCGILVSSIFRRITRFRFIRHLYKNLHSTDKSNRRYQIPGSTRMLQSQLSDSETYYSSFHKTPERRKFSGDEWEKFTKDSTKKALEELVSSPDFSIWAVTHAERITLSPNKDTADTRRRWFPWF